MATYLRRAEGIAVSHNFIAQVWRDHALQPHRQGTFKLSTDPDFEAKVADVVGLYLDPPVGAVVLSIDEKTRAPRGAGGAVRDGRPAAGHRSGRSKLEADRAPGQG
jgi:hypothetical protein